MTINPSLFKAILSMDSYNRGYGAGIDLPIKDENGIYLQIGAATIYDTKGDAAAENIGFYAIAYTYNGETIISFRGTDDVDGIQDLTGLDAEHGWPLGGGNTDSEQGKMAIEFYQSVVAGGANNISLTGHSLGGSLAGYIGAIYDKNAVLFDSMAFELAAQNAYERARNLSVHWRDSGTSLEYTSIWSPEELTQYQSDITKQIISSQIADHDFRTKVYGSEEPWVIDLLGIAGQHIEGEALVPNRWLQETQNPALDLGDGLFLVNSVERHDMATLAIRMFADVGTDGSALATDWRESAKYFWPVMYDNTFAGQVIGRQVPGQLSADGKYDTILRQIIAYSAIDEGDDSSRPYGDMAIRVLYNNANEFGEVQSSL